MKNMYSDLLPQHKLSFVNIQDLFSYLFICMFIFFIFFFTFEGKKKFFKGVQQ